MNRVAKYLFEGRQVAITCFLILVFFVSCKPKADPASDPEKAIAEAVVLDTVTLDYSLSGQIPINLFRISEVENQRVLTFLDPFQGNLMAFKPQEQNEGVKLASIKPLWPDYTGMWDFYVHDKDSIFLVPDNGSVTNIFLLIDQQGDLLNEWKLKNYEPLQDYSLSGSSGNNMYFREGKAYSNRFRQKINPYTEYARFNDVVYDDLSEVVIELQENGRFELKEELGKYPDPGGGYNPNINLPIKWLKGDTLMFLYTYDPFVYAYSLSGELLFKKKLPLDFNFKYFEDTETPSKKDLKINAVESDQIYNFVYDQYRDKYYLILVEGRPYRKSGDRVSSWQEKTLCLVVLDTSFNVEGQYKLGKTKDIYSTPLPMKSGIYFVSDGNHEKVVLYKFDPGNIVVRGS